MSQSKDSTRVLRCCRLLRIDNKHQGALSSLRNLPLCTVEEFLAAARAEALSDVEFLSELGFNLRKSDTSPAVQQGGSVEISRPVVKKRSPVGAGKKSSSRSEGTPLTAKKDGDAGAVNRPANGVDSPSASLVGLL